VQQKEQKISPFKQRILQYVEYLGISKREFYAQTGISRGTLDNHTGLTEETLAKIFATYKNISATWLLHGTGEMLIGYPTQSDNSAQVVNDSINDYKKNVSIQLDVFKHILNDKDKKIIELSVELAMTKAEIEKLKQKPQ